MAMFGRWGCRQAGPDGPGLAGSAWPRLRQRWRLAAVAPASAESIRDALTAAYQTNPKLDAERSKLRATDEDVSRAESGFRPTVNGSADVGQPTINVVAGVLDGRRKRSRGATAFRCANRCSTAFDSTNDVAEANAAVKAGRENLRLVETNVLLEAVTAYMDVVRDTEIVRIRDNNVAVLSRDLEAAETRRAVKEVTKTDVAQAQARRARAVSAADLARANLKTCARQF